MLSNHPVFAAFSPEGKAANERYHVTVMATRRLLLSEGINPDDASNEVWADACQRVQL